MVDLRLDRLQLHVVSELPPPEQGVSPIASVVLPVRNGAATIGLQLDALARQDISESWELIVVDNGSTDSTVAIVDAYRDRIPALRIVDAADGTGPNYARNRGAAVARGEIIAFCDADDVVDDYWLRDIVASMQTFDAVGGRFDLREFGSDGPLESRPKRPRGARPPLPSVLDFLPLPTGANCAVRRAIWTELGGFDECIGYGGDEVEFFWRVQLAGYGFGFCSALVTYRLPTHTTGVAIRKNFARARASADLYRRFSPHGARFRLLTAFRSWVSLLFRSYRLLGDRYSRRRWMVRASQHVGRLVGGLEQRKLFF